MPEVSKPSYDFADEEKWPTNRLAALYESRKGDRRFVSFPEVKAGLEREITHIQSELAARAIEFNGITEK